MTVTQILFVHNPYKMCRTMHFLVYNSAQDLTMNLAISVRDIYVWLMLDKRKVFITCCANHMIQISCTFETTWAHDTKSGLHKAGISYSLPRCYSKILFKVILTPPGRYSHEMTLDIVMHLI